MVEIDPVVHEFAAKYFQLPSNHTPVIADAVAYTDELVNKTDSKFDYIVHDVFTGGAEPVSLFTLEFLQNLYALLKPNGVVAIVRRPSDYADPPNPPLRALPTSLFCERITNTDFRTMRVISHCLRQKSSSTPSGKSSLRAESTARTHAMTRLLNKKDAISPTW